MVRFWLDLPIILNKHLGLLQTHAVFRRDAAFQF